MQLILSGLFVGQCPCGAVNKGTTTRIKTMTLCSFSSSLSETGSSPVAMAGLEFSPLTLASGYWDQRPASLTWLASFHSSVPWLLSVLSHVPPSWSLKFHPFTLNLSDSSLFSETLTLVLPELMRLCFTNSFCPISMLVLASVHTSLLCYQLVRVLIPVTPGCRGLLGKHLHLYFSDLWTLSLW